MARDMLLKELYQKKRRAAIRYERAKSKFLHCNFVYEEYKRFHSPKASGCCKINSRGHSLD